MTKKEEGIDSSEPRIFISHRHQDKKIADILRNHFKEWGVPSSSIFQSSDRDGGLTLGNSIPESLEHELMKVNLLILVYTSANADWSYCMWECGIAQGKSTVKTRTIVLQCTTDSPSVFKDKLKVIVDKDKIYTFTKQFHKKPDFFTRNDTKTAKTAFQPTIESDVLSSRANRLIEELLSVLPSGTSSSRHLWDYLRLRLEPEFALKVKELGVNGVDQGIEIIKDNVALREPRYLGIGNSIDTAVRQFGYASFEPELKLNDLIVRWQSTNTSASTEWVDELYRTLFSAIMNIPTSAKSQPFKSVRADTDWWFSAVVTRMNSFRDHSLEFDVYLVRVPSPLPENLALE